MTLMTSPRQLANISVRFSRDMLEKLSTGYEFPFDETTFPHPQAADFLRYVFLGVDVKTSLQLSGLSWDRHSEYLRKGGSPRSKTPSLTPEEPYITYCELLEQCLSVAKTVAISNVVKSIWDGDIESSKWWLSRRHPSEFGNGTMVGVELDTPTARARVVVMTDEDGRPLVAAELREAEETPQDVQKRDQEVIIQLPDNGRQRDGYDGVVNVETAEVMTAEEVLARQQHK